MPAALLGILIGLTVLNPANMDAGTTGAVSQRADWAQVAAVADSLQASAPLEPLTPEWRNAAYPGFIADLRPRNSNNMKFMFLGEPVPTVYGNDHAYGGFVQMRKKSILWFQAQELYFYQVRPDGTLCSLVPAGSLSPEYTTPQMVNVEVTERQVWVEPPTRTEIINHGSHVEWVEVPTGAGHYETEYDRRVDAILPPGQGDRLHSFLRSDFNAVPHCQ